MVPNADPVYLRLSDGAVLGVPTAADGGAVASGPLVPNSLIDGVPLVTGSRRRRLRVGDRARARRRARRRAGGHHAPPPTEGTAELRPRTDPNRHRRTRTAPDEPSEPTPDAADPAGGPVLLVAMVGVFVVRLVDIQVVRARGAQPGVDAVRSETAPCTAPAARSSTRTAPCSPTASCGTTSPSPRSRPPAAARAGRNRYRPTPTKTVNVEVPLHQVLAELGAVIGKPAAELQKLIDDSLAADPDSDFAYAAKLVDTETYEQVKKLDIPWVVPYEHPGRRYPNGAVAGNLIGFMGDDGDALAGLELSEDQCLAAEDGESSFLHSLKDWVAIPGSEVVHKEAHDGGDLQLTIDSDLQWDVQRIAAAQVQATGAQWATVTVMEAKTGRLSRWPTCRRSTPTTPPASTPTTAVRARSRPRSSRARR